MFGAHRAPDPAVDVGAVTLEFTDDTHRKITWPVGAIPIEREIFDEAPAFFLPVTGWSFRAARR